MKYLIVLLLLLLNFTYAQEEISNKEYFEHFFDSNGKNLLLLGENHSSSVASTIFPKLIKYLHENNGLNTLLLEFGPAEAYFYSQYLKTGDEKFFGYTIYASFYKDWKKAWREIYNYNKTLKKPINIRGFDFDRTRTFAYALYNIFKKYSEKPKQIDSLMNVIKTQEFYKTYTIDYPTEEGKAFLRETKNIINKHKNWLEEALTKDDSFVLKKMVENNTIDFGKNREKNMAFNVTELINSSEEKSFLMLVGRDHCYYKGLWDDKTKLARFLRKNSDFGVLSGVILHENSQQWDEDFKETITLFEIKNKDPWKDFFPKIDKLAKGEFTIIPLIGALKPLTKYTDYILVARNEGPIGF